MQKNDLSKVTTNLPSTFAKILKKINANGLGILFVVKNNFELIGSISDGDIRRALLKKENYNDAIAEESLLINRNPISLPSACDVSEIQEVLNSTINGKIVRCIPLVDQENRIVDYSTRERARKFPILEPKIGKEELFNVTDAIKSGWVSSKGAYLSKFENSFSSYLKGGFPVAVSSGTTALQIALVALGIKSGDEVIVPNFTFGASINSIINSGATPIIAEVEKETWTIDITKLKKYISLSTKAIMPVHIYGQPCKMDEIKKFAKTHNLLIIEDCAEALGARYKNNLVGADSDCCCFSFFANKTITTGEGGMAVFKSPKIAKKARMLINHGLSDQIRYYHENVGYNFRMTNMQAAIGVAQMEKIEILLKERKNIFKIYDEILKKEKLLTLLPKNNWSENSYWLYTFIINGIKRADRNKLLNKMQNKGIECRPGFYSLNLMEPFKKFGKGNYSISNELSDTTLSLPTTSVNKEDQKFIIDTLISELKNIF